MSTGLIIVIALAAVLVVALLALTPRMRERKARRTLASRRERVAGEHRTAAAERERMADAAERRARVARQEAERERADARVQRERADLHEHGMADDELIDEGERERFSGVAGTSAATEDEDATRRADMESEGGPTTERDRGSRFERERAADDVRASDRPPL